MRRGYALVVHSADRSNGETNLNQHRDSPSLLNLILAVCFTLKVSALQVLSNLNSRCLGVMGRYSPPLFCLFPHSSLQALEGTFRE